MKRAIKLIAGLIAAASLLSVAACAPAGSDTVKIGVAMPTKSLQRWIQDGDNMKKQLEAAGYTVDLQYANDDTNTQVGQVENMITAGCDVLVIAAIEGSSLSAVIDKAKAANIPVIAYDRLLMNSDGVSYYATFDNFKVGVLQGNYVVDALDLKNAAGPFNIEFFAGDPGDNNARFFFDGAMSIVKEYLDNGKLVCVSGQTAFDQVATAGWKSENAQSRMDNLITANYASGTVLDVVLCSNDSTAFGVTNALDNSGQFTVGENWPIVTGQDCDKPNTKNMIAGKQSMSVFKDTRTLAAKVVEMITAIVTKKEVPVNDTKTYENGKITVPSFLCEPVFADANNYKELLIDSGYYTEADLA